ncbi:5'/3'-nucleotidase SurE [Synergistes jonesii]|uniref:5'/3'-nucleotidase SurE n=1 Tax=Synergistes jonesii TaxID=2754 RepID=UPI003317084F
MKKILITNDDGIFAEGICALAKTFSAAGYEVLAVAPDRERSASGHSMTMDRPLQINKVDSAALGGDFAAYSCDGTPTDCVIMGVEVLNFVPDLLLSGINCGPNLGDDFTYSGTVCAALEGLIYGYPSIALSLLCGSRSEEKHFATAADAGLKIAEWLKKHPMEPDVMYNVNVPNLPAKEIAGVRVTKKGTRRYHDKITVVKTPFGGEAYWVGGSIHDELRRETDVWAVAHGYISITPAHLEVTAFDAYEAAKRTPMESEIFGAMTKKK